MKILQHLISPKLSYALAAQIGKYCVVPAVVLLLYGLYGALYAAPTDFQQGQVYRIIYIHVPCAVLSLGIYVALAVAAFIFLVWKIKVMDVFVVAALRVGAVFTALTLLTGSIWGKPTWGAWWVWDARLTSELILLFIYLANLALRNALGAGLVMQRLSAIFACVGCINIPIIHYSVDWWQTLHQGATILRWGKPEIAPSMLHPLLAMLLGMLALAVLWLTVDYRRELLGRVIAKRR